MKLKVACAIKTGMNGNLTFLDATKNNVQYKKPEKKVLKIY
jgi:hypothetical protein